jgi:hypothetical protein
MCAEGAIAHAKMVEAEREEVRALGACALERCRQVERERDTLRTRIIDFLCDPRTAGKLLIDASIENPSSAIRNYLRWASDEIAKL